MRTWDEGPCSRQIVQSWPHLTGIWQVGPTGLQQAWRVAEDCSGASNNDDPNVQGQATWFPDADADGFGSAVGAVASCDPPAGYVFNASDCADEDAAIWPGAEEVCDGLDNNCDDVIDPACASDEPRGGCGCATSSTRPGAWVLAMVWLLGVRRRS